MKNEAVQVMDSESEISSSDVESHSEPGDKLTKLKKQEDDILDSDEDYNEDDFDLIEYLDDKTSETLDPELNPNGQYFVCYDVI